MAIAIHRSRRDGATTSARCSGNGVTAASCAVVPSRPCGRSANTIAMTINGSPAVVTITPTTGGAQAIVVRDHWEQLNDQAGDEVRPTDQEIPALEVVLQEVQRARAIARAAGVLP